jgi:Carboxypeptidase regulatory-like domain/TonB dependent receptor
MCRFLCNGVISCLLAIFVLTVGMATSLRAQETLQTSSIFGTVTDNSGALIPGVLVEVISPALQGSKNATTDNSGAYRISELPAGTYRITYSKAGFKTDIHSDFVLDAGFAARSDIALQLGSITQTVEVAGQSPVIDTATTTVSADLDRQTLDTVPTTRSIYEAVDMAPGVRPSTTPDIGGNQLGEQQSLGSYGYAGNTVPLVDGINTLQTNSLTGTDSSGDFVDFDSIASLRVISTGGEADIPTAGTVLMTIMKSGGNEFHGGGHGFYEPKQFQATNLPGNNVGLPILGGSTANQLQYDWDAFGDLGGRIIRDKLWFYGGLHFQYRSEGVVGYIGPNGGAGFDPISDDAIDGKVTYQATKNLKFIGNMSRSSKIEPQRNGSPTVPYGSTWNYNQNYFWTAKGELTWTPSPKFLIDALGGNYWQPYAYPNQAGTDVLGNPWTLNQTTGVNSGPLINVASSDVGSHNRLQYTASLSWFPNGKHSFQFGSNIFLPQGDYKHFFTHPAGDYELETCTVSPKSAICPTGTDGTLVPYELLTFNFPLTAEGKERAYGFYGKDVWRVTNRLTLNYGARFDHYRIYHDTENEPTGPFSGGGSFPYQSDIDWNSVTPRVGVAYDLTGSGKTVIRGSYGMYNVDTLGQFDITNYNPAAIYTNTYNWAGDTCQVTAYTTCNASAAFLNAVGASITDPGATTFNGKSIYLGQSGGITGIVNRNLRMPFFHTFSATFERALSREMSIRAVYVGNYMVDEYDQTFPNRPISTYTQTYKTTYPAADPVRGGQPISILYYPAAYNKGAFNDTEYLNRNGNGDHFNNFEFTLTRRQSGKWSALGSFNLTKNYQFSTQSNVFAAGESAAQPVAPYQTAFPINETWDYTFRSYFTYDLPYRVTFGLNYQLLAGAPSYGIDQISVPNLGTVSIPVNKFGTDRAPLQNVLNLRFGRIFPIKEHDTLEVTFELFNALNVAPGTSVSYIYGTGTKTFGYTTTYLDPTIGRVGVTYKF